MMPGLSYRRRQFLAGTAALTGAAALGFPFISAQAEQRLKVATYGGLFQRLFR